LTQALAPLVAAAVTPERSASRIRDVPAITRPMLD
jgi:hypothetical protein